MTANTGFLGLALGVILLGACAPVSLVKSDLPPVLPGLFPPGPSIIHPPQAGYTLAGRVSGLQIQHVEAKDLAKQERRVSEVDPRHEFRFEYLSPCHYQLTLVGATQSFVLQSVIQAHPERPRFLEIELKGTPLKATIDGLPVAVEIRD